MIIPAEELAPETLDGIVREWLMRQGEDWGLVEGGLDEKEVGGKKNKVR